MPSFEQKARNGGEADLPVGAAYRSPANSCSARCEHTTTTTCGGGDGCCPAGCTVAADPECAPKCGNGRVDPGEKCDGNCPLTCPAADACLPETLRGNATTCDAECTMTQITSCTAGDSCCPAACAKATDADCTNEAPTCGNGRLDAGEACDPAITTGAGTCPTSCTATESCTTSTLSGSAAACTATCVAGAITTCTSGDGCCGPGCNSQNDGECTSPTPYGSACTSNEACGEGNACETSMSLGYCSKGCRDDAACGTGAHCLGATTEYDGLCVRSCVADTQCERTGYVCYDGDEDGTKECLDRADGTGAIGAACQIRGDCAGGVDGYCLFDSPVFPGGACTQLCVDGKACPAGSHCESSFCEKDCSTDADCPREHSVCFDAPQPGGAPDGVKSCVPGFDGPVAAGGACTRDDECATGWIGKCKTDDPQLVIGGYCGAICTDDVACPAGTHCHSPNAGCLRNCTRDEDCNRPGYICEDVATSGTSTDGVKECVAGHRGPGAVGTACTADTQCGGVGAYCVSEADWGWLGGACTVRCDWLSNCADGFQCVSGDCLATCRSDADCSRPGFVCGASGACVPGGDGSKATGEACSSYADCAGGERARCFEVADDAPMCLLLGCQEFGCPDGLECAIAGEISFCVKQCESDADCGALRCHTLADAKICGP